MKNRWLIEAPVLENLLQDGVMRSIEANAEFHSKAGMRPKIVRRTDGKCCEWCSKMAGTYEYPDGVPPDVYRRHKNCTCTVEYYPGDGKKQDVWSKKWSEDSEVLEERKTIGLDETSKEELERRKILGLGGENENIGQKADNHSIILTDDERYAINQYISSVSYFINEKLREHIELTESEAKLVRDLDSALEKLSSYEGTVYRSISSDRIGDTDGFWRDHQPFGFIQYDAYTSTGVSVYDETMEIQMIIKSKTGRDIRAFNPTEEEILFKRNAVFKVTSVDGNTIYMEEV